MDFDLIASLENLVKTWKRRPSWDEYFIATAILISTRSSCERLNVGCVIVSSGEHKNRIVAAGYNGHIAGAMHNSCVRDGHEQNTVHAEQNAIADAARRGVSLNNSIAYITHFPCITCAKLLASVGVKSVRYRTDYNNDALALDILKQANIEIIKL